MAIKRQHHKIWCHPVLIFMYEFKRQRRARSVKCIFGHVERMDEYRMPRRVLMAEVCGGRVRGRPRLGWMDGVKVAFSTEE